MFNIEIKGIKLGVVVDKSSYWGMYKMHPKPFEQETIDPAKVLAYAYYSLLHNRRIQDEFLKGKPIRL